MNVELLKDIVDTIKNFGDYFNYDSFSEGQLKSKEWLINELMKVTKNIGTTYLLCGWYGILPAFIFNSDLKVDKIRSFDIDDTANQIADSINRIQFHDNWTFKAIRQDIIDVNFREHSWQCWSKKNNRMSYPITDVPNTIINTSCEHTTTDWFKKIPKGKLVALQSNDSFKEEGHMNAVLDIDDFKKMYPLTKIYYEGSLKLPKFTRYMLIGVK